MLCISLMSSSLSMVIVGCVLAFPILHYKWARIKSLIWQNCVAHQIKYAIHRLFWHFEWEFLAIDSKDAYNWHNFFFLLQILDMFIIRTLFVSISITQVVWLFSKQILSRMCVYVCVCAAFCCILYCFTKCGNAYTIWCDNEQIMVFKQNLNILCEWVCVIESFLVPCWQFNRMPKPTYLDDGWNGKTEWTNEQK